jgi:hypothetical protein
MRSVPESIIRTIRTRAAYGVSTGRDQLPHEARYYRRCTHFHWRTGTVVMFTRDTGHHTSGWFKNPDFERCLHLSLSFREPRPEADVELLGSPHTITALGGVLPLAPFDPALADAWTKAILGDARRLSWCEGAFSAEGRAVSVRHWRVFCDRAWEPIKPRGEVYDRELTEAGWQSWSEQHAYPNWIDAE